MAIAVPVADLRAQPHTIVQRSSAHPADGTPVGPPHDPLQETQLLYGEQVRLLSHADGWAYVEALEQPEFTHAKRWQGYPGWLPRSALLRWEPLLAPTVVVTEKWAAAWQDAYGLHPSPWRFALGTHLLATDMGGQLWKVELWDGATVWMPRQAARPLEELRRLSSTQKRRLILRSAELMVGDVYFWGGRSPAANGDETQTGVDCSGLVNLAYRAAGIDIPRDAHEQFLRARPVNALQPGDLIFLSERANPRAVVHVMLYAGDGAVIEGPGTGLTVRRLPIAQRLGHDADSLAPGTVVEGQTVSFGTYLP
ncbi:MAG: NlpC/P60 family protein [Candidatus Omnitrophota bacterium]|nr:NlpC/P60 family protein [Candidatus Omnitrophota bacterium]